MAWISVHQSIVGPKLRQFRSLLGCSQWEAEGILVSLWLWGLDNADKYGLISFADRSDIEIALSGSSKASNLSLSQVVDALIESGWIDETSDGIYIHDWEMWQEQWYKAKERREKDTNRKRESRSKVKADASTADETGMSVDNPADIPIATEASMDEANQPPAPATPPAKPKKPGTNYGPEFETFWDAYPRKIGKAEALKKYQARRKDGWSFDDILLAAKNYALQCNRQHTAKEYIKHPKTFLSENTPFVDYLPKEIVRPSEMAVPNGANPFEEYGKEEP